MSSENKTRLAGWGAWYGFPILLLGFVCVLTPVMAQSSDRPDESAGAAGRQFAIADFDGDHRPDLATVEIQNSSARATRYSIHLQLSAQSDSAIGLTAPWGGLQLTVSDVNGDEREDLIVRANLDSSLVAVLINDGHGEFTIAEPGSFPNIEDEPSDSVGAAMREQVAGAILAPSRGSYSALVLVGWGWIRPHATSRVMVFRPQEVRFYPVALNPGRSPPCNDHSC